MRSSNEARCHNEDGTLKLTLHPSDFVYVEHTHIHSKKKKAHAQNLLSATFTEVSF